MLAGLEDEFRSFFFFLFFQNQVLLVKESSYPRGSNRSQEYHVDLSAKGHGTVITIEGFIVDVVGSRHL